MPSRQRLTLPPFDPAAQYVACKNFQCSGINWVKGEPFDKTVVATRRLRQLAAVRRIAPVDGTGDPSSLTRLRRGRPDVHFVDLRPRAGPPVEVFDLTEYPPPAETEETSFPIIATYPDVQEIEEGVTPQPKPRRERKANGSQKARHQARRPRRKK